MKSGDDPRRLYWGAMFVIAAFALAAAVLLVIGISAADRERQAVLALARSNLLFSGEKVASMLEARASELARACLLDRETSQIDGGLLNTDDIAADARIRKRLESIRARHPIAAHLAVFTAEGLRYPRLHTPVRELESVGCNKTSECTGQTDGFGRPYVLLAARPGARLDDRVLADVVNGKWDLSVDYADYVLSKYGYDLMSMAPQSPFMDRLRFAQTVAGRLEPVTDLAPGQVARQSLDSHQLFLTALDSGATLALSVDMPWIASHLLPECGKEAGAGRVSLGRAGQANAGLRVAFPSLFPAWEIVLESMSVSDTSYRLTVLSISGFALSTLAAAILLFLRNVERQKRLNEMRMAYVNAVSHDLKTPLATIRLYAEMLADSGGSAPAKHEFPRIIAGESDRVSRSIDNALEFSRIERGERHYHLKPGSLKNLLGEIEATYSPYWIAQGFQVFCKLPEQSPPVRFDPESVRRAILNLIDNAVKFSGDSRTISLRLRAEPGWAVIEVEDSGRGIAPVERSRIFDKFYRTLSTAHQGGYGIGLYIVASIVRAHGGGIDLESEAGRGSCFRLRLPLCDES